MRRERGQAGIETLLVLPFVLLVGLGGAEVVAWVAGAVVADTAAAAGARALTRGEPVAPAARAELPVPFRADAQVTIDHGVVRVRLGVPSLVPGVPVPAASAEARP